MHLTEAKQRKETRQLRKQFKMLTDELRSVWDPNDVEQTIRDAQAVRRKIHEWLRSVRDMLIYKYGLRGKERQVKNLLGDGGLFMNIVSANNQYSNRSEKQARRAC